ncbi:hypothetical protein LCGC14_2408790 [marine sediment metagenome]|uniref:DUF3253 domain-containing protein n=2 Tax=root TaxID=1 RepID=A0A831VN67_9FLAO|nr:DUF3253 domain-containing protein [Pricia antarctica]
METEEKIMQLHRDIASKRGLHATYCPSEVAKAFAPEEWRDYMEIVREVADSLVKKDELVVMQKGDIIEANATEAKGAIRLRLKK